MLFPSGLKCGSNVVFIKIGLRHLFDLDIRAFVYRLDQVSHPIAIHIISKLGSALRPYRLRSPPHRAYYRRSGQSFAPCQSAQAHAARIQTPMLACTSSSCQWPTTTLRLSRIRLPINPNSLSPCADWFRFMKSMSISTMGFPGCTVCADAGMVF